MNAYPRQRFNSPSQWNNEENAIVGSANGKSDKLAYVLRWHLGQEMETVHGGDGGDEDDADTTGAGGGGLFALSLSATLPHRCQNSQKRWTNLDGDILLGAECLATSEPAGAVTTDDLGERLEGSETENCL